MDEKPKEKRNTITEEQAQRAAETLINSWLRSDENNPSIIKKDGNKK